MARCSVPDFGGGIVVQDHIHPRQGRGDVVDFLAVDGDAARRFGGGLEQERAGTASGIVERLILTSGVADADDLGNDEGDLGGGVELPFAFAGLGGEVAHQVLVGVAQEVIALGAVAAEIEGGVLENGDQVGEAVHHLLAPAELVGVVEVGDVDHALEHRVRVGQPADDLVDLIANAFIALEGRHIGKTALFGDDDGRVRLPSVLI